MILLIIDLKVKGEDGLLKGVIVGYIVVMVMVLDYCSLFLGDLVLSSLAFIVMRRVLIDGIIVDFIGQITRIFLIHSV